MTPSGPVLNPIHSAAEPSWWPIAIGWWILLIVLIVVLVFGWRAWRGWSARRAIYRELLKNFEALEASHSPEEAPAKFVAGLSVLLRRYANWLRPEAAGLKGEAWLMFLDGKALEKPYSQGIGRLLLDAPYRRSVSAEEAKALHTLVKNSLSAWAERTHA